MVSAALSAILSSVLQLVLPLRCAACGALGESVCAACLASLVRIGPVGCERCGAPGAWPVRRCSECTGRRLAFASARAAVVYEDRARALVTTWKDRGRRDLAPVLARVVADVVAAPPADVVTFVPPDGDRRLERGHAPPEGLAHALAERWELPAAALLTRAYGSRPQRGLDLAGRRANVRGAFRAVRPVPRSVCLVDDVYTSGATMNACATALRRAGARRVDAVSLARAVR